jgi:hypothetical protein
VGFRSLRLHESGGLGATMQITRCFACHMCNRRKLIILSLLLLPTQLGADPAEEIVSSLLNQSFWNQRPLSISFQEQRWSRLGGELRDYNVQVRMFLTDDSAFGSQKLVGEVPPVTDLTFAVETRFLESSEVTAVVDLFRPEAGHAGEATFQEPDCDCTRRALSIGTTPMSVATLINGMDTASWMPFETPGDGPGWILHGVSTGDPEGYRSEWEFAMVRSGWVPRRGTGYFGNELHSTFAIETDPTAEHYRPLRIETTVFHQAEPIYRTIASDFEVRHLRKVETPVLMDLIPPGVIVSEYRHERPFAYMMGKRPPNADELAAMIKDDAAILAYQAATATRPHMPPPRGRAPGWLLVGALLLLLLPAAGYHIQRRRA